MNSVAEGTPIVLVVLLGLFLLGASCGQKNTAKTPPDPTEVGIGMDMTLN